MLKRLPAVLALLLAASSLVACGSDSGKASDSGAECRYPSDGSSTSTTTPPATPVSSADSTATLQLSVGAVPITLHGGAAPCTVNSFVALAKAGYFDGTPCHRLTTAGILVLQCGDPTGSGQGGPGYSFDDELTAAKAFAPGETWSDGTKTVVYPAGTLAMANAGADTNGSQFFLVYGDSSLPPAYTAFGTVGSAGLAVLQQVAKDGTADGSQDGPPKDGVKISSVKLS
ncbi:peptidylprolyl isomerase [Nocardioides sp. Kera G14]|uniref:peptidylprolyl isomerase n=1 Tax=Nocardioides sp. Kera G14 TaxID=2884264 RepID=UPI001D111A84|nr:peptidylprolyl isomerase [Nocardioides sp. Kera G14]UDY25238.1 peptidylprolyl isomerase [Nocardioides sp. Kera G14]